MSQRINRRRFSSAAATGFAFTFVPSRAFGANERLNVASIGVGGKGAGEVKDLANQGCNIVALCDVDENRAAATFKRFPNAKVYADFRVMLEQQKDIDAVSVSTPDHTHAVASVMAMKLGKHVYCQKPLTHSVYEARVMMRVAREMKVATQMGNQAHAGESIRRGVELVRAGMLGDVAEVHVWTNRPIWPQGLNLPTETHDVPPSLNWDLWLGPAPERPYHKSYLPFNWRGWWDFGTGALGDMACHIMDMPYWALELGSPTTVEAESGGATDQSPPVWSTIKYQFPSRGDRPAVTLTWYDGKQDGKPNLPSDELAQGVDLQKFGCLLVGQKGKLYFQRGNRNGWIVKPADRLEEFANTPITIPRVDSEDAEWVAACKGGPAALSNFDYASALTETVLLGNVAIRCGEQIAWDAKQMRVANVAGAEPFIRREYRKGWII